jgi:hypothetical protein
MSGRFSLGIAIFFSSLSYPIIAQQYVISTIAGGSPPPVHAALATAVSAGMPHTVTADRQGNVYFASTGTNAIYKVDAGGMLTRVAGYATPGFSGDGRPATQGTLNYPLAVATDSAGKIYVSDAGNNVVRVLRPVAPDAR